ncbi:hypothetical protein HDV57DRAFT_513509 [Trichoderma longibrachiatum]|uniref:Uncharacterized protein n=1 Tax=Trichoderma longibrachiatum ATCC 18648 TaxID=983965 RepID=A0A2T4CDU3_TRILO|nr:hypothetical protein M440DRAFT_1420042 [Trichoderma longibrachiatum ATCC 18648]
MDIHTQNPLFHALDIILAYLNHGNSLPEIEFLSSAAETWCRHHLLPPAVRFANNNNNNNNNSNNSSSNLDDVLWTHPHLFDLSIHSFARLYSFDSRSKHPNGGISSSSSSSQPPSLTH